MNGNQQMRDIKYRQTQDVNGTQDVLQYKQGAAANAISLQHMSQREPEG